MAETDGRRNRLAAAAAGLLLGAAAVLLAQNNVVFLWPDGAPGSENWTQKEAAYKTSSGQTELRNVVKPSITLYLPPAGDATGTAVVVAPGGAFRILAWENEGTMVAEWLQRHGIAAFLLKYRLVDTGTDEEFAQAQAAMSAGMGRGRGGAAAGRGPDAARGRAPSRGGIPTMDNPVVGMSATDALKAIETVRARAAEWRVDPAKIGIIGFSAGGWASVMTGIQYTSANRPNFVGAIYACCLNPNNSLNATNIKIPDDAPPIFILHAYDDGISASGPALFQAWKAANRPAELHTYAAGGHGFGMTKHGRPTDGWIERFTDWLRYQKLLK
ncbi:MAG: alpha/beta hydrolase [Bryobacteraceae bacterium]